MLSENRVAEIAQEVATANLGTGTVERTAVEPTTDSIGRDALRITIIVKQDRVARLQGDQLLDTLYQLNTRLAGEGENRFPIVEYATPEELEEELAGSES
jgi:predicted extracellular nuclease